MRRRRRSDGQVGEVELLLVGADVDDGVEGSVDSALEAEFVELLLFLTAHLDVLLLLLAALDHLLGDPVQVLVGGEVPGQQAAARWAVLLLLLLPRGGRTQAAA